MCVHLLINAITWKFGTWGVVGALNSMEHAVESVLDQKQKVIGEFKL